MRTGEGGDRRLPARLRRIDLQRGMGKTLHERRHRFRIMASASQGIERLETGQHVHSDGGFCDRVWCWSPGFGLQPLEHDQDRLPPPFVARLFAALDLRIERGQRVGLQPAS